MPETTTLETTTTSPISTSTFRSSNALTITQGTVEPGIECPYKEPQGLIFLASLINCEKYYICYLGNPVPRQCITGMHWNQLEYFCDDPFYAHCQVDPSADPNPFPKCPRKGKKFLPHETNCEYFIFCNEGVGYLNRCTYYYGWDMDLEKCVLRSMAKCYPEYKQKLNEKEKFP